MTEEPNTFHTSATTGVWIYLDAFETANNNIAAQCISLKGTHVDKKDMQTLPAQQDVTVHTKCVLQQTCALTKQVWKQMRSLKVSSLRETGELWSHMMYRPCFQSTS